MAESLRQNSAWIWLAAALAIIVAAKVIAGNGSPPAIPFSVSSAKGDGAMALYLWLGRIGYTVEKEDSSDLGLGHLQPGQDTLVVMATNTAFSSQSVDEIQRWVRSGGRFVLATDGTTGAALVTRFGFSLAGAIPAPESVRQPLLLAPPTANLDGTASTVSNDLPAGAAAVGNGEGAVLVTQPNASGDVLLLTDPSLLDNDQIGQADNRRLALNLVGSPGRTVGFDEYSGASTTAVPAFGPPGTTDWFHGTVWGAAIIFVAALWLLYLWLTGWRLGPAVIPIYDRHRPLTEYVVSMGGLLRRARKRADVLNSYQQRLRRLVVDRFGPEGVEALSPETERELDELLDLPSHLSEDELIRRARRIVDFEEELRRTRV